MTDLDDLIDELVATAAPRTTTVRVCARGDLVDRHDALTVELHARLVEVDSVAGDPEIQRVTAEILALEQEQESSTVAVTVTQVGRRAWLDTVLAHPARPEDRAMKLDFHATEFPPAAVALCTGLSAERVAKLEEKLPPAEWAKLWNATWSLNATAIPHPKLAAATELARASGASWTSEDDSASPEASS